MNLKIEALKACIFILIGAFLCNYFFKPKVKEVVKTEFVEVYVKDKSETQKTHVKKYDKKGILEKEVISENVKNDIEKDESVLKENEHLSVFAGAGADFKYENYRFSEVKPKASIGAQYDQFDLDVNSDMKSDHGIYLKLRLFKL